MYYEIYADSLLLINLVMNLYCLELVNRIYHGMAGRGRIVAAAFMGACGYLLPFGLPGGALIKMILCFPVIYLLMLWVAFRPRSLKGFYRLTVGLFWVSCSFGGAFIVMEYFLAGRGRSNQIYLFLLAGILLFWLVSSLFARLKEETICEVTLTGKGAMIRVKGLLDSGNGLVEPVSGQPVCVMDQRIFDNLWRSGNPSGLRAVTYHSMDCSRGVLWAYPVPEIRIERNGVEQSFRNLYVGVSREKLSESDAYHMIIPPTLLEKHGRKKGNGSMNWPQKNGNREGSKE